MMWWGLSCCEAGTSQDGSLQLWFSMPMEKSSDCFCLSLHLSPLSWWHCILLPVCECCGYFHYLADIVLFKDLLMYSKDRVRERQRYFICGLLPKWPQCPKLGWSKARCQEGLLHLPRGCRDSRSWAILHCFPRGVGREWVRNGAAET